MPKILVVEDEGIQAMVLCNRLRQIGYQVCSPVATGEQAIHSMMAEQPDLLLVDVRLIGALDGIETVRRMRDFAQTPVIFMTGYIDSDLRAQALALQPAVYLAKPVDMAHLESLIQTLLPTPATQP